MTRPTKRRSSRASRGADALFAFLIPFFFMLLAGYQQVKYGHVDKYILGILGVFGLGALGWRLDSFFESYAAYRAGREPTRNDYDDDD